MGTTQLLGDTDPHLPVIVGVGQLTNRTDQGAPAVEPVGLMIEAARIAQADTGSSTILEHLDVVAAVPTMTWRYRDPAAIVAQSVGAHQAQTWYATVGGNTPQSLVNRICGHISRGRLDVALLVGAEAGRARMEAKKQGQTLDWTAQGDDVSPDWTEESPYLLADDAYMARNLIMPLQMYPVFESALWHESGRTMEEHLRYIAKIWSSYSKVAAQNPHAWTPREFNADELIEVTSDNRMVALPYRRRMVANPRVDMASATIICSTRVAAELGIPKDRWVFVHSGTDARDRSVSRRPNFTHSPAIASAGNAALRLAGLGIDDVAHLDIYSCYPSAVQVAISALGIDDDRQLSVYGGLPFAGGPWNNPVGHAIASMVDVLRSDAGSYGLITANGGNLDKHAFGVYSTKPPTEGFRYENTQAVVNLSPDHPSVVDHHGGATIEAWTVMYDRDSMPTSSHIAALTSRGERTWAISVDSDAMAVLSAGDVTGTAVHIDGHGSFEVS